MLDRVIGIMAMVFGFVAWAIENYGGACCCFGFAFILLCISTLDEYFSRKKRIHDETKQHLEE